MTETATPLRDFFRQHPALLVSGLYLVASVVGMYFAWDFLRRFGINVFLYAELGDFLLASLKEPLVWALVLLSVVLVATDNWFSRRSERNGPSRWFRWYGCQRYRRINYIVTVIMAVMFLTLLADYKAKRVYAGDGEIVEVRLADSDRRRTAILLGTTTQWVFLFDVNSSKVFIHHNENVASIMKIAPGD